MPHSPCRENFQGEASSGVSPAVNWLTTLPKLSGSFWPSYFFRAGLGSNVSMWLGPPTMNRKITDLALGAKFGGLAARGFTLALACAESRSRDPRAIAPKPCPARARMSRRVSTGRMCSRYVDELIAIHQGQTKVGQLASRTQELFAHRQLHCARRPRQRQLVSAPQLAIGRSFTLALEARSELRRSLL